MEIIEYKDANIEWHSAKYNVPKQGVVLGLTPLSDVAVPVVYVPFLGWFHVENNGKYLYTAEVKFWAYYNLPK
ncbi:MAG: hypothetical protein ACK52I_02825 [Pseudomonadota bacterium]|jgi:hypothetical protein